MSTAVQRLYFVGIGGIGMSGLARYFRRAGAVVGGYDRTPSALTESLAAEGMAIHFDDDPASIPEPLRERPADVLVVRTPAVPASSLLLAWWTAAGARIVKRSELLGLVTRDRHTYAVAGTHGKTTVSTLLTHLLHSGGVPVNAFLGGISANYNTNVLLDEGAVANVVEADEYDRSFLQLRPTDAIITAADPDHLDIYGTPEAMLEAYTAFAGLCSGALLVHERVKAALPALKADTYAIGGHGVPRAEQVEVREGAYHFDLVAGGVTLRGLRLGMAGRHNVENATAAAAMALRAGVAPEALRAALASFRGVERRFQTILGGPATVFIDDYAHHPAELDAAIRSARELHPTRSLTIVFQPHLFTRTRDLADGFARSLAGADRLYLLDIYPAREEPIPGITSAWLLDRIALADKHLVGRDELIARLSAEPPELLLTLGAGDIDRLVPRIADALQHPAAA
ncbi:MAG: UDP-N-acetylmuramate--L-alanine ligase [Flavobacteriales bacterium]|jgi:UDP-N-acetylmuramate--alanine ligase|nr:UDP-N-acetylmuramate--L-alanine ligase [Flavobacteriales bacterium]MBK7942591.1 UDP-N-acetylmuramate--L-alanine ligase [Flavobacteriales bacterium]MBK8950888.1 UDP-N-acetylmuramate--L-alanine ligase [Flavobacteriales bacterium]MBK9699006.1 UDP-N-acetylmuramate--L-alanine ligase [Flavobacteriales bacterium]